MNKYSFSIIFLLISSVLSAQQKTFIDETKVISLEKVISLSQSDTVELKDGNYFIHLNRPIILKNKKLVFRSSERSAFIYLDGSAGFSVSEGSIVAFEGITFKNTRYSSHHADSAVFFNLINSKVKFENCRFEAISSVNSGHIIRVEGAKSVLHLEGTVFENCTFKMTPSAIIDVSDSSIAEMNRVFMKSNYAVSGNSVSVYSSGILKLTNCSLINIPVDNNPENVLFSGDSTGRVQIVNSILYSSEENIFSQNIKNTEISFSFISYYPLSVFDKLSGYHTDLNQLEANSNLIDSGDPEITDPDGTRSDIGSAFYDQSGFGSKLKVIFFKPSFIIFSSFVFLSFGIFFYRKKKSKTKSTDFVQVFLFGKFELRINNENKTDLLTNDQQELFIAFLLESLMINQAINLDSLFLSLWPDDEYKTAKNTRNQIIKRLRDRLEKTGCFKIESEGRKNYRLTSTSQVWVDYWEFLSNTSQNRKTDDTLLNRGALLSGFTTSFFEKEREYLQKILNKK